MLIKDWTLRLLWPKEVDIQYLSTWFLLNISRIRLGYCLPVLLNALKLLHGVGLVCTELLLNSPVHITQMILVFSSTSSHLTFAISEVLWETTQTYPEEVRGGKKRIIPWMCCLVPGCSWWFTLQAISFLLLNLCEVASLTVLHCLLRHLKECSFFKLRGLAKPCLVGVKKCLVGLCQKAKVSMKLNLEVLLTYQTGF